ncbi:hypothetical protein JTB14_017403 [Gonioctena quinquepunctata]|nr:hypothetical protein JTB14_017403 [Gonioctena quinquepunctata]
MKNRVTPVRFLLKNWLLVGIFFCILSAGIYPKFGSKEGPLSTGYTVKYGAVFIIFFISGLSLSADSISHTFQNYKLHFFIQIFTFLLIPIFTQAYTRIFFILGVNSWVLKG